MLDLTTFLQSIGPAIEIAKRFASKDETQNLIGVLAQSRILASDNAELQGKVTELERKLQFQGTLRYERNVYWSDNANDMGPFCSACWDGKRQAVHLRDDHGRGEFYTCPICRMQFEPNPDRVRSTVNPMSNDYDPLKF